MGTTESVMTKPPLSPLPDVVTSAVGNRILGAADRLFPRYGLGAIGVDALVAEAGTTKRTLYQRFDSKDGVIAAYLRRRAHRWQAWLVEGEGVLEAADPQWALDRVFSAAKKWSSELRGCAFVNAWGEVGVGLSDAGPLSLAAAEVRAEKSWMSQLFTQIAGSDHKGAMVHAIYEGAQVCASTLDDPSAFESARDGAAMILRQ